MSLDVNVPKQLAEIFRIAEMPKAERDAQRQIGLTAAQAAIEANRLAGLTRPQAFGKAAMEGGTEILGMIQRLGGNP